jgi:hypothetical protein
LITDGAVYNPDEEILPTPGLRDHVTAVFDVPETVAVNCCVRPWPMLVEDGLTVTVTVGAGAVPAVNAPATHAQVFPPDML